MSRKKPSQRPPAKTVMPAEARPVSKSRIPGKATHSYWFMLLLCVLPFIFSRATLDPVVAVRYLALTIFMAVFVLAFYIFSKNELILPGISKWVFIIGLSYFIWNLVSLFGAINKAAAYFELSRILVNLVLLLIITDMFAKDDAALMRLSKVLCVVAIIHALVSTMQYYGIAFKNLPGANALPYGLMANRNLMGSAQMLLLPFSIYLLFAGSSGWKKLAGFSIFMLMLSIVLSQTRSAWLATVVFMIVAFILAFIFLKEQRKKWLIATVMIIGGGILIGFILTTFDKQGALAQEIQNRTASFVNAGADSSISTKSANDRIILWKKTASMIGDHPLTGVGANNWSLEIPVYGTDRLSWNDRFYVPDRVHNVFLQVAAELGIPGLLLFLAFWLSIIYAGWYGLRKATSNDEKIRLVLLLSALAAFAVDCMLSFPLERIEHTLYVMLIAGAVLGYYVKANKSHSEKSFLLPKWIYGLSLLIIVFGFFMGTQRYRFEKNLHQVKAAELDNDPRAMLDYAAKGKQPWIKLDLEGMSMETKEAMAYSKMQDYKNAINSMKQALALNPNSPQVINNFGTYYTELGDYKNAIPYYEKALKLAPGLTIIKKNLSLNYYNVGWYKDCIQLLESFNYQEEPVLVEIMNQSKQLAATQTSVVK